MTHITANYSSVAHFDLNAICEDHEFKIEDIGSYHVSYGVLTLMLHDGRTIEENGEIETDYKYPNSVTAYDDDYNEIEIS